MEKGGESSMEYVLGIDGGQTRTRALVAREDGKIIRWGCGVACESSK